MCACGAGRGGKESYNPAPVFKGAHQSSGLGAGSFQGHMGASHLPNPACRPVPSASAFALWGFSVHLWEQVFPHEASGAILQGTYPGTGSGWDPYR